MISIIIGNIIAFIASILMVYSGMLKQKKKILYFQTVQIGMSVISNIILSGITGAIINALSMIRNILCYKDKLGIKEKIVITILAVILTFKWNNLGYIGLLPLISTIVYIWLMNIKNVKNFKLLISFTMLMWLIYDIAIKSYASAIFDFMCIFANIITIFQIKN
ncbi:MAG: YgjV family protein [Erysipelotrichaceae bacterium]|nr:YgjV family protein [Erysipelotrichaceae bacterium]